MDKIVRRGALRGCVLPPCSKSYAQRALAASLLAKGCSELRNIEFCDDTRSAMRSIECLGARIEQLDDKTLLVEGGLHPRHPKLEVGESGLAARLFTPIASLGGQPIRIEGRGSLLQRTMLPLVKPLKDLGVWVRHHDGCLPLEVCGPLRGGETSIDGSISSQFITGLLLALPLAEEDTQLHVSHAVSRPYLDMTMDAAHHFGVEILHRDYEEFYIAGGQRYTPSVYAIEGDWSAAAMMLVAGATSGEITVENIDVCSRQADTAILRALMRAGVTTVNDHDSVTVMHKTLHAFEFDATDCPDLFPALAALAASAEGVSKIVGTDRLEHKECHRGEAIFEEYSKLGIEVDISQKNTMYIRGGKIRSARVNAHNDHRMAMSLAVAALNSEQQVVIEGAECVAKSYPRFFDELERLKID